MNTLSFITNITSSNSINLANDLKKSYN